MGTPSFVPLFARLQMWRTSATKELAHVNAAPAVGAAAESAKNSLSTLPKIGIPAAIVSSEPANVARRKFERCIRRNAKNTDQTSTMAAEDSDTHVVNMLRPFLYVARIRREQEHCRGNDDEPTLETRLEELLH